MEVINFITKMKIKIFLLFVMLFITSVSKADTTDFWHIYINDSIFQKSGQGSEGEVIVIKREDIGDADVLGVRHYDDTPCYDCAVALVIRDIGGLEVKHINGSDGDLLKVTFKELLAISEKNNSDRFLFSFYEDDKLRRHLFTLKIE